MSTKNAHRVVVVGGGYAGTLAALRVAGRARGRARVTLVDGDGVLVQRLRLHEVAAGRDVRTYPLGRLGGRRVEVVRAWATGLDLDRGAVRIAGEEGRDEVGYDTLVLATGSTVDLDGAPGAAHHAHSLSTRASAQRLRDALAAAPGGAAIAVVGGGFTGIEAASELAEARRDARVRLLSAGPVGGGMSERARAYLGEALGRLGVEVVEGVRVARVDEDRLLLADGAEAPFALAVWCGGFRPGGLARESGLAVDARGGVIVDATLRSVSHPEVLAAGDAAACPELPNGARVRMTCQAGMPTGAHAADTIVAALKGREAEPFDFGYIHMPLSLGRRDGLIQFVHRDDTPKDRLLTGRMAARYKEIVSSSAITGLRLERLVPGATVWRRSGRPAAREAPAEAVA